MTRDFHGDNAKIAIELILTSNRCNERLHGRDLSLVALRKTRDVFGGRCCRNLPFNVDLHIRASGFFARV